MFKKEIMKFGADGKSSLRMKVFRAKTGKWEELSTFWHIKNFLVELGIQLLNPFRVLFGGKWQYAHVLTTIGEGWMTNKLHETDQTTGDFVHWGTGAGTAAKASTTLFTPSAEARVTAVRTVPMANRVRWVATLTSASVQTITNAGNFTAATAGTLIVHGNFTGIALAVGDRIEITIELTIT